MRHQEQIYGMTQWQRQRGILRSVARQAGFDVAVGRKSSVTNNLYCMLRDRDCFKELRILGKVIVVARQKSFKPPSDYVPNARVVWLLVLFNNSVIHKDEHETADDANQS